MGRQILGAFIGVILIIWSIVQIVNAVSPNPPTCNGETMGVYDLCIVDNHIKGTSIVTSRTGYTYDEQAERQNPSATVITWVGIAIFLSLGLGLTYYNGRKILNSLSE